MTAAGSSAALASALRRPNAPGGALQRGNKASTASTRGNAERLGARFHAGAVDPGAPSFAPMREGKGGGGAAGGARAGAWQDRANRATVEQVLDPRTRMVLCASPEYLAQHGRPAHPHELARHVVISYTYWSSGDNWSFQGPAGEVTVRTHSRIHANNGDTCRAAALAHQGIILQPDFLVHEDLRSGALVELMPHFRAAELGIFAVYPTRKQLPLKVRRLVDFLVDALLAPPWAH